MTRFNEERPLTYVEWLAVDADEADRDEQASDLAGMSDRPYRVPPEWIREWTEGMCGDAELLRARMERDKEEGS